MKALLAIPSHYRPYDIEKKVLYWIGEVGIDWKVFCEENQELYYMQTCGTNNLVTTPVGSGLMGQMVQIAKYAKENNYDVVLKMDDDMRFTKDKAKKTDTANVVQEYITQALAEFNNPKVGMISVAKPMEYRYGPKQGFVERKKPVYGNYFVRTKYLEKLSADLLLFDDLWISIEVKLAGDKTLTYLGAYEDAITHKNSGGLQTYNRDALGKLAYDRAKDVYPKIEVLENSKHNKFDISVKNYF